MCTENKHPNCSHAWSTGSLFCHKWENGFRAEPTWKISSEDPANHRRPSRQANYQHILFTFHILCLYKFNFQYLCSWEFWLSDRSTKKNHSEASWSNLVHLENPENPSGRGPAHKNSLAGDWLNHLPSSVSADELQPIISIGWSDRTDASHCCRAQTLRIEPLWFQTHAHYLFQLSKMDSRDFASPDAPCAHTPVLFYRA